MKYPFLLAALLLCSANLAARHPDTHTLLQPDTLSLRQSDALSAQKSDAPFVRPPYLRPGDTIGSSPRRANSRRRPTRPKSGNASKSGA